MRSRITCLVCTLSTTAVLQNFILFSTSMKQSPECQTVRRNAKPMKTYFFIITPLHQNTAFQISLPLIPQHCFCCINFNNRFKSLRVHPTEDGICRFWLNYPRTLTFFFFGWAALRTFANIQKQQQSTNKTSTNKDISISTVNHLSWSCHHATITNWKPEASKTECWCPCLQDDLGRYLGKNCTYGFGQLRLALVRSKITTAQASPALWVGLYCIEMMMEDDTGKECRQQHCISSQREARTPLAVLH